jgi:uncharacterized protein (DUF433 family)
VTTEQIKSLPIQSHQQVLGGTVVFAGTRVPVRTIFDYLADGCDLDEFLDNFPSVKRHDAVMVLQAGAASLLDLAREQ